MGFLCVGSAISVRWIFLQIRMEGGGGKQEETARPAAHCLKINDTETGEVSGRVPKVLRQKDDTERMEA